MPVVNREVVLPVPRERAWELVTEPDEMETWLGDDVDFEPEEGAPVRLDDREGVVEDERFTLLAPDAYREDYLEVALYDAKGNQLARESLYEDDGED